MKKYIVLLFGIFLFSIINTHSVKSETAICTPDCPETPFITKYPLSLEFFIGDCRYKVSYYIRKACNIWCDILIWSVKSYDPPPCGTMDPNTILNIAAAQIIQYFANNPNEWFEITGKGDCIPHNIGECNMFWRVSKASCWKFDINTHFNTNEPPSDSNYFGTFGYCIMDICCLTWYKVCMDQFGQVVVTEVEAHSTGPCPYDPSGSCKQVCE